VSRSKSRGRIFAWDATLRLWMLVKGEVGCYALTCRLVRERDVRRLLGRERTRPVTTFQILRLLRREDAELTEDGQISRPGPLAVVEQA
jgi:hypothetical protein